MSSIRFGDASGEPSPVSHRAPHDSMGSPLSSSLSGGMPELVRAVMFTRFEDVEGYVVSASDPPNVMKDQFKDIGYQFLPDKGLCWRLISLSLGDQFRIIGVPGHIDDARYPRRAFVYCFCLIVNNEANAVSIGKLAAAEMAEIFLALENDPKYHLLSDDSKHGIIEEFLKKLRKQLNEGKHVNVNVIGDYWLQFVLHKAGKSLAPPQELIKPWSVPVSLTDTFPDDSVELTPFTSLMNLLESCNGSNSVCELSQILAVDYDQLVQVLSILHARELVYIVSQPVDKYSRVRLVSNFHTFFDDLNNRQEAVGYCIASNFSLPSSVFSSESSTPLDDHPTSLSQPINNLGDYLVRMYCRMDGNTADLGNMETFRHGVHISVRHMVMYGLLKGFLRLKQLFPFFPEFETTMVPVLRLCDGTLCWDEIGFKCNMTRSQLMDVFMNHDVLRIWK